MNNNVRVTTMGTIRTYKSDLMRATQNMSKAMDKVLTQRTFNSYAEDPAGATLAFKLRRQFSSTSDQLTNVNAQVNRFQSAWTAVGSVKVMLEDAVKDCDYRGINDPTAAGRIPLGQALAHHAESIVQTLNLQYGDAFIFSGNDGMTVPFSWDETTGDLLYRGISVNSGVAAGRPEGAPPHSSKVQPGSPWDLYYNDPLNPSNKSYSTLVDMTYETAYVDVGAGLSELEAGKVNGATAFNTAISGLDFLRFGMDEDGDPLNAVSLVLKLSDIFSRCDPESGDYVDGDQEIALRLSQKLEATLTNITVNWTALDGKSSFLESAKMRLSDDAFALNEQILGIEQVDLADAITDFSWAQYCYNAALQVGTQILSQSLLDYLR